MIGSCIRSSGSQWEASAQQQGEQGTLIRPRAQQGRGAAGLQGGLPGCRGSSPSGGAGWGDGHVQRGRSGC